MKFRTINIIFFIILINVFSNSIIWAQPVITAEKIDSRIDIKIDGQFFTSYIFAEDKKYPFFYPVNGPSGASVTSMRNSNYPHHSSLFFGADKVNGGNYWQEGLERGQILSVKAEIIENGSDRVVIVNECIWVRPGAESPIKDTRRITISAPSKDIFQIDFDIALHALKEVEILKTNHSLFSGRMATDLTVSNGGTMINAHGDKGEEETFGKPSPWIDFYSKRGETIEGMAIMQHPSSTWSSAPWFTRDYGFFSPTQLYWPKDPEKGTMLEIGEIVELRYRVLVHSGDHETANIGEHYEKYKSE
ncbi:MAG: PmoA family protein [Balneolales bacterium]